LKAELYHFVDVLSVIALFSVAMFFVVRFFRSQLRRQNEKLREESHRLSMALTAANEGIWDWNVQTGKVTFSKDWFFRLGMTGPPPGSMKELSRMLHEEDAESFLRFVNNFVENDGKFFSTEFRIRSQNAGHFRWIQIKGQPLDASDQPATLRIMGTMVDITRMRMTSNALRRSEEDLKATLFSINDAVITTDPGGGVTRINPAAEELLQISPSQAQGRPISALYSVIAEGNAVKSLGQEVLLSGEEHLKRSKVQIRTRSGSQFWANEQASLIRSVSKKSTGVIVILRNISQEVTLGEQLHQAQKMEAIGQLAGGIAHDFNNMLGGISGFADLIQDELPPDSPGAEYTQEIIGIVSKASRITNQLLAFSRRGKFHDSEVNLLDCIDTTVRILQHTLDRKVSIRVISESKELFTRGDAALVQNALLNLGINAGDAMPEGGEVHFEAAAVMLKPEDCLRITGNMEPGDYVCVAVRDSGAGIEPELLDRIFEPFFTTKQLGKGTGLGLAAVMGTMNSHHGGIRVRSKPGLGSTFELYFPLCHSALQSQELKEIKTSENVTAKSSFNHTILVVDDETSLRMVLGEMLKRTGCTTLFAKDGSQAVDVFRQAKDQIDLVFLDMMMPNMDGASVFIEFQKIRKGVPIVLCSGFTQNDKISELLDQGAVKFLEKPFRYDEVRNTLQEFLPE